METKNKSIVVLVIIISLIMFSGGAGITYYLLKDVKKEVQEITNITKTEKEVTVNENGIADAVEKVYDAVVTVTTYKKSGASLNPYASGTGFVYKVEGDTAYILTNYHVINGSNKVSVTFTNKEIVDAKVLGSYMYSDVAVLSVNANKILKVAELGSSEKARLGDTAFAVGSPVSSAYGWTVTRGILSGKDRLVSLNMSNSTISSDNVIMNLLQTDVAINSGNSGGPLCNSNGEVIGITSSKVSSTGVEGIGFAIPIEEVLNIASSLEKGEEILKPYLGIGTVDLAVATYYGYTDTDAEFGIYVQSVEKDSSAEAAGIKKGDIITYVDDIKVESSASFRYALYKSKVGDTITIKVLRDGLTKDIKIKLQPKK